MNKKDLPSGAKMKITVLVENSAAFPFLPGNLPGLLGEHGLAVLIDSGEEQVLYDTGRGRTLMGNLEQSKNRPEDINKVVISHGHLDHTGSLMAFLQSRKSTDVYCHLDVFSRKYGKKAGNYNYIGIPYQAGDLAAAGAVFNFTREPQAVAAGIVISGPIPRVHQWEQDAGSFFIKEGDSFLPDNFEDEQALFVDSGAGLVVITGCGHAGIINTLEYAVRCCGSDKILAVLGGLHLAGASPERIGLTIRHLKEFGVEKLVLGHCTGFEAMCRLWREFGDRLKPLNVGLQMEF